MTSTEVETPYYTEQRIEIPSTGSPGGVLVGTLVSPTVTTSLFPPSVVIISHGFAGHRNYCYHKLLAHKLAEPSMGGLYSVRFDFRSCGESADLIDPALGRWLEHDCQDFTDVLAYVRTKLNLYVLALVGHSRGALASLLYVLKHDQTIPHVVNCSGRFRTEFIIDKCRRASATWDQDGGYFAENVPRHLKRERVWVPATETFNLARPDLNELANLPPNIRVMTIYGMEDQVVSLQDATMFANVLTDRHCLHFIPLADHNFYSRQEHTGARINHNPQVVELIAEWLSPAAIAAWFLYSRGIAVRVPRLVSIDGAAHDVRDFGGWTTQGRTVRHAYLYHSVAEWHAITERGKQQFRLLNVRVVFDLRVANRSNRTPSTKTEYDIPGVKWIEAALPLASSSSSLVIRDGISKSTLSNELYHVLNDSVNAVRKIFELIRDEPDKPFIIQGSVAGNNHHAGIVCALILLIAGVDADTIARDYELSNSINKSSMTQNRLASNKSSLSSPGTNNKEDSTEYDDVPWMARLWSDYETMRRLLNMIDADYGNAEEYLRRYCKFDTHDIDTIRQNLLQ
ncbi:Alpha/Beta hydrolase protein [Lipomyces japonicus]|uniref:Alpha/Beta hydrolase protein n=1 Tax=Lipomyces japonicus TaxID=56871 RepID=UPI0034D01CF3